MEACSKATKTLAFLLTVKPCKIVRFSNTGVSPFIRGVHASGRTILRIYMATARLIKCLES